MSKSEMGLLSSTVLVFITFITLHLYSRKTADLAAICWLVLFNNFEFSLAGERVGGDCEATVGSPSDDVGSAILVCFRETYLQVLFEKE
jgi:hypothetical protein